MSMHLHGALVDPGDEDVFECIWSEEDESVVRSPLVDAVCIQHEPPDRLCSSCRIALDDPSIPLDEILCDSKNGGLGAYAGRADIWARRLELAA